MRHPFYAGYFSTTGLRRRWPLWTALALALCWLIHSGFEQHFGGLEATRQYLAKLEKSGAIDESMLSDPNYAKRIAGNRIFATFSNPDALAAAVILLLPASLAFLWQITPKVRPLMRWGFVVVLAGCGLACIYWSGSKAGWLVTLVIGVVALLCSNLSKRWKVGIITVVLLVGVAGFGLRYAGYFQKQKNSMGARFTYWHAALKIARRYPVLGSGPGTFSVLYGELKKPDDEMARLCHNDYLEQACDAGIPTFVLYCTMVFGGLYFLYRYRIKGLPVSDVRFAASLGLAGLCLHSTVEYHLYIPALAWPMFFLFGFLMNSPD